MRYRFFTYNIDFAKTNVQETQSLKSIADQADVVCVQEAKHLSVARAMDKHFNVHQNLSSTAKQGVAIAWRRGKVKSRIPTTAGRRIRTRISGYVLGVSNMGLRMLPRYINYRVFDFNGTLVLVISTHRPPQRFRRLWGAFDRALIRFIKSFPIPVIVGMDSNQHTHALFARLSGMVWRGIGIDGFWLSKSLVKHIVKGSLKSHPRANSDHHPVSIDLDF